MQSKDGNDTGGIGRSYIYKKNVRFQRMRQERLILK